MFIHRRDPLAPVGGTETPAAVALSRRRWLRRTALLGGAALAGGAGYWGVRRWRGSDEEVLAAGATTAAAAARPLESFFPGRFEPAYAYERPETLEAQAARYTNFYEFSATKRSWRYVDAFEPLPWSLAIDGLCRAPLQLPIEEFLQRFQDDVVERQYRHRCVERWAMAIPWTGIPLHKVLRAVDPLDSATHVRFVSFDRPEQAPGQHNRSYPWPYTEGLTLAEAANDLVLLAAGMYGHPLLKQHGAPLRLVVPWKYGFKSIKSIQRIELVAAQPATFWSTIDGWAYPFESNVDPRVPIPWPQGTEEMLGTGELYKTQQYNGYAEYVAGLYA